jgi:hypothetical protein
MIAARRPGLYIFHRGEERGCLGSRWIMRNRPKLLEGMEAAIAFDRAGCGDVITHQSHGRTCSDSFAASMAHALNALDPNFQYRPDNRGVFTDTNEYAGAIAECSNLSVGYQGQHGPRETLDVAHCEKLLAAMLKLDMSALVIERDALKPDHDGWGSGDPYRYERDELAQAAAHYPMVAARLLQECGITLEDFQFAVWGDDEPGYRPLMAS